MISDKFRVFLARYITGGSFSTELFFSSTKQVAVQASLSWPKSLANVADIIKHSSLQ